MRRQPAETKTFEANIKKHGHLGGLTPPLAGVIDKAARTFCSRKPHNLRLRWNFALPDQGGAAPAKPQARFGSCKSHDLRLRWNFALPDWDDSWSTAKVGLEEFGEN